MTNSICRVSPSDQTGTFGNIMSRMDEYEKIIARLEAINLYVQNLSDLVNGTGVMRDFELYAGDGWGGDGRYTGYAMSSTPLPIPEEEQFNVAVMDDGRVIYGYRAAGTISGAAKFGDTAIFTNDTLTDPDHGSAPCTFYWEDIVQSPTVTNWGGSLHINETATYLISMFGYMYRPFTTEYCYGLMTFGPDRGQKIQAAFMFPDTVDPSWRFWGGGVAVANLDAGTQLVGRATILAGLLLQSRVLVSVSKIVPTPPEEPVVPEVPAP